MQFINEEVNILKDNLTILTNISKIIALDIYYNPLIRKWVYNKYYEHVLISTEPT